MIWNRHADLLASEIRQAVRTLLRHPAFFAAAVATMALGLTAVTAIFAVADRILLQPLPYPSPERLYSLSATLPGPDGRPTPYVLSPIEFLRVRSGARTLEQVEVMTPTEMAMVVADVPETVRAGVSSPGFLSLFGLSPTIGRGPAAAEARSRVAVLDGGFWERRFGRDPAILGRSAVIDGVPYTIIGVTEAGYQPLLQRVDVWLPLDVAVDPARPGQRSLLGAARLAAGATPEQAQEELKAIQAGVARDFPQTHSRAQLRFIELHEWQYGSYRPAVLLLLGGVTFLLLIACTNVANLALGRVTERRGEIALRMSIGASRGRILRQYFVESAVVGVVAAAAGAMGASWCLHAFLAIYPNALPADVQVGISPRVVAGLCLLMCGATVLAGVLPAWWASATPPAGALAQATLRVSGHARARRLRESMLVAQVAFAVLLMSVAGALGTALQRLHRADTGIDAANVLTMQLAPPARYAQAEARAAFVARLIQSVEQLPGVLSVGSTQTTWQALATMQTALELEGRPVTPDERVMVNVRHVTPGFFPTLRVGVAAGRAMDERDVFGRDPVSMVSQSFADRFWPGENPLGKRVRRQSPNAPWLTVVGVARDVMDGGLGVSMGPTIYLPYLQQNTATARVTLVVRTQGAPMPMATTVQRAIWAIDPQQPVDAAQALDEALAQATAQPRFRALVMGAFSLAGLVLVCVGVYSVAAYAATVRRREIGVRMALGAEAGSVVALLVRQALTPVAAGVCVGAALAAGSSKVLDVLVAGSESLDVVTIAVCGASLLLCAMVASWLPARRLAHVAPVETMRAE